MCDLGRSILYDNDIQLSLSVYGNLTLFFMSQYWDFDLPHLFCWITDDTTWDKLTHTHTNQICSFDFVFCLYFGGLDTVVITYFTRIVFLYGDRASLSHNQKKNNSRTTSTRTCKKDYNKISTNANQKWISVSRVRFILAGFGYVSIYDRVLRHRWFSQFTTKTIW